VRWQNDAQYSTAVGSAGKFEVEQGVLIVRDEHGQRTPQYLKLMADMGMPV
jgi:hypothetical protein